MGSRLLPACRGFRSSLIPWTCASWIQLKQCTPGRSVSIARSRDGAFLVTSGWEPKDKVSGLRAAGAHSPESTLFGARPVINTVSCVSSRPNQDFHSPLPASHVFHSDMSSRAFPRGLFEISNITLQNGEVRTSLPQGYRLGASEDKGRHLYDLGAISSERFRGA